MSRNQHEVLGIGSPIVDIIVHVDEAFLSTIEGRKGGMELINSAQFHDILKRATSDAIFIPGGSAANVLRGLANLGHRCEFMGKVGLDDAGSIFVDQLEELHIHSLCIPVPGPTAKVISLVTPDGQRTCRTNLGVAADMRCEDLKKEYFQHIPLVHIEGYTLDQGLLIECTLEYAKSAGAKISLDLASFEIVERHRARIMGLLKDYVDILFANAEEVFALTGKAPKAACRHMASQCKIAVVSMAKEGCWVAENTELMHCPAYPVEAIDSTGAGDLFASGFLHGYLKRKSLATCAHYGALLGAAIVQIEGAVLPPSSWEKFTSAIQ